MEMKDIQAILQMLKENEIHEFELEHAGTRIKIARGQVVTTVMAQPATIAAPMQPAIAAPVVAPANNDANSAAQINPNAKKVESPIVGTFYRKPSPDAEPFVKEGDRVKKGATLCIIEAMKVMNEIDAPCDGVVQKILPTEGEVVEFGEVLFLIAQ
ncbi:MAG: acetyl-CoA carboxylase biotin carboxyl carrier protein [Proteobacteria bacterium]|nr:acetyl-CoA carboxylase biotin carboxyl carrier protein [Pseudomonadota bacterium]